MRSNCHVFWGLKRNKRNHKKFFNKNSFLKNNKEKNFVNNFDAHDPMNAFSKICIDHLRAICAPSDLFVPSTDHLIFKYRASKTQKFFFIFSRAAYKFLNFCRTLLTVNISEMADKEKRFRKILGDKGLKTLKQVIKQKHKFLGNTNDNEYMWAQSDARFRSRHLIYMSNTTIETANIKTLLEEMKPLFVYIISYVLYERLHFTWKEFCMKINFRTMISGDTDDFWFWEERLYESPLGCIQYKIEYIEEEECYISYQKPLRVEIMFKTRIQQEVFHTQISQSDSDDSEDEEKEELSINDFKTFKLEQCVICLEEEPKVLFCNCGHICIVKSVPLTGTIIARSVKRKTRF